MKATEVLMSEHRVIERVIGALEKAAAQLESGQDLRHGFFLDAAEFIKEFADGCHHSKEEGVLFTTMVEYGMPLQGSPVAVMLAEHEQGRLFTRGMKQAAQDLADGETSARELIVQNARGYAALLRQHILKEDRILFPMAEQMIPTGQHLQVYEEYQCLADNEAYKDVYSKYLALAESLEKEIGASA